MPTDSMLLLVFGSVLTATSIAWIAIQIFDRLRKPETAAIQASEQALKTVSYDLGQFREVITDEMHEIREQIRDEADDETKRIAARFEVMRESVDRRFDDLKSMFAAQNTEVARQQERVGFLAGFIESEQRTLKAVESSLKEEIAGLREDIHKIQVGLNTMNGGKGH